MMTGPQKMNPSPTKTKHRSCSVSVNPMEEPKIIGWTLKYFSCRQLKLLRPTCKVWNHQICKILRKRKLIEFSNASDLNNYLAIFSTANEATELPHPFAKFHFHKIRLNLIHDNYLLRTFFKRFYTTITHIQMDFTGPQFRLKYLRMCVLHYIANSNVTSVVLIFKDFYDVWPASLSDDEPLLPLLKSVRDLTLYGFGRESTLKTVLTKILPYFPHISTLEAGEQMGRLIFEIVYGNLDPDSHDGFTPVPFPQLTHINFNYIYPTQMDAIVANHVKLKSLKGEVHMCSDSQLQTLLDYLSPTLEELCLECHNGQVFPPPPRVNMTALVYLELTKFRLELGTLQYFPMLKKLKLKMVELSCTLQPEVEQQQYLGNDNLFSLVLEICKLDVDKVTAFGKLFPSLRRLDLPFQVFAEKSDLLGMICREMRHLEELELFVSGSGGCSKKGNENGSSRGREMLAEIVAGGMRIMELEELNDPKQRVIKAFDEENHAFLGRIEMMD